jgi:hypothetical protein
MPQAPPMLNQFNSMQFSQTTGIGQNQMSYQSASNANNSNNQTNIGSDNTNKAGGPYKRQFYYTLSN